MNLCYIFLACTFLNIILSQKSDSRQFKVGEKIPELLYSLMDIDPKYLEDMSYDKYLKANHTFIAHKKYFYLDQFNVFENSLKNFYPNNKGQ